MPYYRVTITTKDDDGNPLPGTHELKCNTLNEQTAREGAQQAIDDNLFPFDADHVHSIEVTELFFISNEEFLAE